MRRFFLCVAVIFLAVTGFAQTPVVVSPQYMLNINFLGSGIYGTTTAVDTIFGYQLTTNVQLQGDMLAAPGGGLNAYMGGASYDLCGIKPIENVLASTSLNCGKVQPFFAAVGGVGRVQQGSSPTVDGPAGVAKLGVALPSASGTYAVAFVGEYGDFGPSITGQSNKGFAFYTGITFGGGNSAAATQAKIARMKRSEAKKMAKLQKAMAQSK
jgi:hypothetical protein